MEWSEVVREQVATLEPVPSNPALVKKLYSLLDLTSLNENDTEAGITTFFNKATGSLGHVAAVCLYPQFVRLAVNQFAGTEVRVATVVNFPAGNTHLETVLIEIGRALQDGAQEIDVVFPYERYLAGERQYARTFIESCKAACGKQALLKVILETGVLQEASIIADASFDALTAGADFIKTSTGKVSEGATLEAAATMLLVIKELTPQLKRCIGFKVSGGVREVGQAAQYVELADKILGKQWVSPLTFRIGASRLADDLLQYN